MKSTNHAVFNATALVAFLSLGIPMWGQQTPPSGEAPATLTVGDVQITGLPDDWTFHHLVFSNPGTEEEAIRNGTHDQWLKVVNDPRYIIQQLKRGLPAQGPAAEDVARIEQEARSGLMSESEDITAAEALGLPGPKPQKTRMKKDWSAGLDGVSATATGTVGTLNSSNISGSSSITIGTTTLTASAPTAASQTGTFSSPPTSGNNAISVKVGSNTLNLSSSATAASSIGTFSGPALSTTSISFTSGGNTVTMTPAGTGAQYTGTFAGAALSSTSIGITSGSNTLTMTPAGTAAHATGSFTAVAVAGNTVTITSASNTLTLTPSGLGTVTFTAEPSDGDTITVGSVQYVWESTSGCSGVNYCVVRSGSTSTDASRLEEAIGGSCGGNSCSANGSATATSSGSVTTITNSATGPITFSLSSSAYTLVPSSGTILASTNNGCTSSTVGSYLVGGTTSTQASDLATAINNCNTSYPAVGATTSYSSGTSFTITDAYPGSSADGFTFTLSDSGSGFSWGTVTAGTAGSASCSGTAPTFTGSFVNSTNTTTLAGDLNSAMTCAGSVGFSTGTSTNTVTVTDAYPGAGINTFSVSGSVTGIFTWGSETAGTNGSASCSGTAPTFTGTFVNSATATTLAGNFNSAITGSGCSAAGFTTSISGAAVTVTDTTLGTATFSASNNTSVFSWSAASAGSNGSYTCTGSAPTFTATYATSTTTATLASNLSSAIGSCDASTMGITSSYSSGSSFTVTEATPGTGGNSGTTLTPTGAGYFAWTAGSLTGGADGTTSGTTFAYWSVNNYVSQSVLAGNIATAIDANATLGGTSGVTAASGVCGSDCVNLVANAGGTGGDLALSKTSFAGYTWSGSDLTGGAAGTGKVQPNAYPAKYGVSLTQASCSDFVIYPTGQAGVSNTANIVAYNNIYTTGCAGAVPSFYWGYNTGGTVTTSPILSEDGTQVAFIQVSGTTASLVVLKWAPGPLATLTTQSSGSAYRSCTAPCMYTMAFGNGKNDTLSAPFEDYSDDLLYVGDDSGNLHQFSGIFNGNPAENTTSPWPVALSTDKVSSPVYDTEQGFQGGYVFVGDMGGTFYAVCGTDGYECTNSGQIHGTTGSIGDAIADAPLVDSSEGIELVFVTTNGSYSYTGDNGVWEFVSSFTTLGTPGVVPVGTGGTGYYLYAGDFDNVYYESGNPAYGHLYVVGNTGVTGGATLYQVEIAYSSLTGTVNSVATGLNSSEHGWPSPLTEFCNNGTSACTITTQEPSLTGKVSTTSPEITFSSAILTSADVGAVVSGTDIPFGATISTVINSTEANLSSAPTADVTSEALSILGGQTTAGTDYVFFSINRATPSGCTNAAGDGCILSYNVSNPNSVALSGSGLNVTTPGTNGCWATGGLIIDNSDPTTTGAQQIYFVNLNGATAGGVSGATSSNCTSATASVNATQASQASP